MTNKMILHPIITTMRMPAQITMIVMMTSLLPLWLT